MEEIEIGGKSYKLLERVAAHGSGASAASFPEVSARWPGGVHRHGVRLPGRGREIINSQHVPGTYGQQLQMFLAWVARVWIRIVGSIVSRK